jgi:methionyl aminopeptidase
MTIALEPMINAGSYVVESLPDNWTIVTKDGKLSAHFEHTIAITRRGADILTLPVSKAEEEKAEAAPAALAVGAP